MTVSGRETASSKRAKSRGRLTSRSLGGGTRALVVRRVKLLVDGLTSVTLGPASRSLFGTIAQDLGSATKLAAPQGASSRAQLPPLGRAGNPARQRRSLAMAIGLLEPERSHAATGQEMVRQFKNGTRCRCRARTCQGTGRRRSRSPNGHEFRFAARVCRTIHVLKKATVASRSRNATRMPSRSSAADRTLGSRLLHRGSAQN